MKIFLNKFVLFILFVIFFLIGYQIYKINTLFSYKDTNSYFYIIEGNGYINHLGKRKILKSNSTRQLLNPGDIVGTIGSGSLGVIEWGDNSITRIGGNSKLEIKESDISKDLSVIKIKFRLFEGKSWSNVVNMLGQKSYFKQEFQDIIAGVRGTVFEVNLDNKYVYVKSHEVFLENTKTGKNQILKEGNFFSLDFFKIVSEKLKDALWQKLNENIDKNYIISLKKETELYIDKYKSKFNINNYIDDKYRVLQEINKQNRDKSKIENMIKNMSDDDKSKLYYMLMFDYQRLNIISSNDDLFAKKMLYRDALMLLATDEDKKTILKYTFYDLSDSLSLSGANISSISEFILKNKDYIKKLGVDTGNIDFSKLSADNLKAILGKNFNDLKTMFKLDDIGNLNKGNIKDSIKNLNNIGKEKVNNTLDSIYNFIKK